MGDLEVKLEQVSGELAMQHQVMLQALNANTAALKSLDRKFDSMLRWLIVAMIGSAMGTEGLRVIAAVILKGGTP